jgi:hypothetical protein
MHARWLSFVVWALLAASLAYWGLALGARGPQAPAQLRPADTGTPAQGDWARLLAPVAEPAAAPAGGAGRYQLLGIVAPGAAHDGEGVALVSVEGAAPRAVRIGQVLEGELRLLGVSRREARFGQAGVVSLSLQLQAPADVSAQASTPAASPAPVPTLSAAQGGSLPTHQPSNPTLLPPTAVHPLPLPGAPGATPTESPRSLPTQ